MSVMRRFSGLAVVLLACGVGQAAAQGYFGQNKVQYNSFEWQVIRTDHFEVYFYERKSALAVPGRTALSDFALTCFDVCHSEPTLIFIIRRSG